MRKPTIQGYDYRGHTIIVGGSGQALVHEQDPTPYEIGPLLTTRVFPSLQAAMQWIDGFLAKIPSELEP